MIDRAALLRNTVLWIMAVLWVVWSYLIQDPAPDPWAAVTRSAFTVAFAIVATVVSIVVIVAWIRVAVDAQRRRRGTPAPRRTVEEERRV
ncbi:MAG TPA: hypothetical protein VGA16_07245 [Candidatus Limnocylindria bacterium]